MYTVTIVLESSFNFRLLSDRRQLKSSVVVRIISCRGRTARECVFSWISSRYRCTDCLGIIFCASDSENTWWSIQVVIVILSILGFNPQSRTGCLWICYRHWFHWFAVLFWLFQRWQWLSAQFEYFHSIDCHEEYQEDHNKYKCYRKVNFKIFYFR